MEKTLLLLAAMAFFSSCEEDLPESTEILGTVIYQDDSKSVEGLKVVLSASDPQPILEPPIAKRIDSVYLAADGKFQFSQRYKAKRNYAVSVMKADSFWPFGVDCAPQSCSELAPGVQYDLKVLIIRDDFGGG